MLHYSIHNLIDICVDTDLPEETKSSINFQIGYFKSDEQNNNCPYQIKVYCYNKFTPSKNPKRTIFHLVKGQTGISYHDSQKKIIIQKTPQGFDYYVNKNFLINIPIQFIFLNKNFSFVHAAAVADKNNDVILFPGPGGVGKTAIVNELVKNKKYTLLGDDLIALHSTGKCLCFPRKFVLKKYHAEVYPDAFEMLGITQKDFIVEREKKFMGDLILNRILKKNLPFMGVTKSLLHRSGITKFIKKERKDFFCLPVEKIFGERCVTQGGNLKQIIFLERFQSNEFQVNKIESNRLTNKIFSIMNHEWVDYMREIFSLGALEIINLFDYFEKMNEIITQGTSHCDAFLLQIPEQATYHDLKSACNKILEHKP